MVIQPASIATRPVGPINNTRRRNSRLRYNAPLRRKATPSNPVKIINMPSPAMILKLKKMMVAFGRSSFAKLLSAGICLSRLWVNMRLPR
ncbi:hypothetical protein D3C81_1790190 [compost metagenome]